MIHSQDTSEGTLLVGSGSVSGYRVLGRSGGPHNRCGLQSTRRLWNNTGVGGPVLGIADVCGFKGDL